MKNAFTHRQIVKHVNQGVTEYYEYNGVFSCRVVSEQDAGDWERGSFTLNELRHNMPILKSGLFGDVITGRT